MSKQTKIGPYRVTLNIGVNSEQCWIDAGRASASLEVMRAMGTLADQDGREVEVPKAAQQQINAWAVRNGYPKEPA